MPPEIDILLRVAAIAATAAGLAWGVYSFLSKRIDRTRSELVARADRDREEVAGRLDTIRDDYLRRAEYVADRERIEARMSEISRDMRDGFTGLSTRIDRVLAALAGGGPASRI